MIFDADDVTTIVDHCNHFTQPQAEAAFPFQYQLAQLRKRLARVAFDFFQGHRVAMACSKPAVAGDVKQTAVAVLDQGASKAMAFRVKYRTTTDLGKIKRRLPFADVLCASRKSRWRLPARR